MITLSQSDRERQILCDFSYRWNFKTDNHELTKQIHRLWKETGLQSGELCRVEGEMRRLCLTHTYVQKVDNENNSVRTYMGKESNEDEIQGFPGGKLQPLRRVKDSAYQCRRHKGPGFYPLVGSPPGGGNGKPLQYSCLENSMDRGAWWATAHGVTESDTAERTHRGYQCMYNWIMSLDTFSNATWSIKYMPKYKFNKKKINPYSIFFSGFWHFGLCHSPGAWAGLVSRLEGGKAKGAREAVSSENLPWPCSACSPKITVSRSSQTLL